jgi:E3 ubiquitin-protein ligase UBR3
MADAFLFPASLAPPVPPSRASLNRHRVLNCTNPVIKEHCYWPLVSDLNSILSHRPVAMRFVDDNEDLLYWWFLFLSMFQGMNVNYRESNEHVEYEPNTYFAAFTAELEAIATPMWALAAHFTTPESVDVTRSILVHCLAAIRQWMDETGTSFTHRVSCLRSLFLFSLFCQSFSFP